MEPGPVSETIGRRLPIGGGRFAFIPGRLPPDLHWNADLANALAIAAARLGELVGLARDLPNPRLLTKPFMAREAALSSRIEGTIANVTDVFKIELQEDLFATEQARADAREVANYSRALEYGIRSLQTLPLSLRLIRELHRRLLSGVPRAAGPRGEFRRIQNWIGPDGARLEEATFIPPPPGPELQAALDDLERFLHSQHGLHPLIEAAVFHYQFEAIHPFADGNGRVGRLMILLLLVERKLLPQPLLYLSAHFERHREAYYRHLREVSTRGAWEPYLHFFLEACRTQSEDAAKRARSLLDLRNLWREQVQEVGRSAAALAAVDRLFVAPVFTISGLANKVRVTFAAASRVVARLESLGMVRERTGKKRDRVFIAEPILRIVQRR